jgi:hypothetical protein
VRARTGFAAAALAAALSTGGCSSSQPQGACQCPKPVAYDTATLDKITKALEALPPDNVLHQAMEDYEYERDDLRFCNRPSH